LDIPEEPTGSSEQQHVKPCPAPGVPVSRETYEKLKKKAKSKSKAPVVNAQEDPSAKK